jgi:hypothetical protein
VSHFDLALDLPHAGTVSVRIVRLLMRAPEPGLALERAESLAELLETYRIEGENPVAEEARAVTEEAARLARELVDQIEALSLRDDKLGQLVRNVFECLALGEEGARISLRAGEDPASPMRP